MGSISKKTMVLPLYLVPKNMVTLHMVSDTRVQKTAILRYYGVPGAIPVQIHQHIAPSRQCQKAQDYQCFFFLLLFLDENQITLQTFLNLKLSMKFHFNVSKVSYATAKDTATQLPTKQTQHKVFGLQPTTCRR